MKIEQQTFDIWKQRKETGDIKELQALLGCSRATVLRIFRNRETSSNRIRLINGYFEEKAKGLTIKQ